MPHFFLKPAVPQAEVPGESQTSALYKAPEVWAVSPAALKGIFSIKLLRCVFNVVLSEKSILL